METIHHQHYARDGQGNLVHIDQTLAGDKYYCLSCGEEMIAKKGEKNEHHFAHKKDTPHCSSETYLHNLAKRRIAEWLGESKDVSIQLPAECAKTDNCIFKNKYCYADDVKYLIKDYYELAGIEMMYGGFKPDILLLSKDKKTPLFVEICVNHPCSEEKIYSGYRIIEFTVKTEHDIDNIVAQNEISRIPDVKLYGFKVPRNEIARNSINRIVVFKSGETTKEPTTCRNHPLPNNAIGQLLFPSDDNRFDNHVWALLEAIRNGHNIKSCLVCQHCSHSGWSDEWICRCYTKYGKRRIYNGKYAYSCPRYLQKPVLSTTFWGNNYRYFFEAGPQKDKTKNNSQMVIPFETN